MDGETYLTNYPAEVFDPATGARRTVRIVAKLPAAQDGELFLDSAGNTYRRRGVGRIGLEPVPIPSPSEGGDSMPFPVTNADGETLYVEKVSNGTEVDVLIDADGNRRTPETHDQLGQVSEPIDAES
jgi:hypothetical protein